MRLPLPSLERNLKFVDAVPGHAPPTVFEYSRDATLLPSVPGFELVVDDDTFAAGAAVRARLAVARLRTEVGFHGEVNECSLDKGITVRGEAPSFGSASLWLRLDSCEGGTQVDYGIDLRAENMRVLPALAIVACVLSKKAEAFAALYRQNIVSAIVEASTTAAAIV